MKVITTIFLCSLYITVLGQTENSTKENSNQVLSNPSSNLTNAERYGLDYELVNYTFINGDSTILGTIDLDELITHRKPYEDIDISNLSTGITVRVYSIEKARIRREQTTPKQH